MATQPHQSSAPATNQSENNIFFLTSIYDEASRLLTHTYDYFAIYGRSDQEDLEENERAIYTTEMTRLTIRLSCIMSWLSVRKAVLNGKMSEIEALDTRYRLSCPEICLIPGALHAEDILPTPMRVLMEKTLALYERIQRLDQSYARQATAMGE